MKPRIHRPADGEEPRMSIMRGGLSNRNNLRLSSQPEEPANSTSGGFLRFFSDRLVSLCFPNVNGDAKCVLVDESDDANNPNRINELATKIANGTVDEAILFLNECNPAELFELLIRIREIQPSYLQDILNELGDSNNQLKSYLVHIIYDPSW